MNEKFYFNYYISHQKAVQIIDSIYQQNKDNATDAQLKDLIYKTYKAKQLDPDGKAIRSEFEIRCTADGLCSILKICKFESNAEEIAQIYKRYRSIPIFFFPSENGGINASRAQTGTFKDRIDYTLFDLKCYLNPKATEEDRRNCKLFNAYTRPKTKQWLESMKTFENIIDWYGVKGIFTNNNYEIFDIQTGDGSVITDYLGMQGWEWNTQYYNNVKEKIDLFIDRN